MGFFKSNRLAKTSDLNEAIEYLERKLTLRGGSGVTVSRTANGTSVSARGRGGGGGDGSGLRRLSIKTTQAANAASTEAYFLDSDGDEIATEDATVTLYHLPTKASIALTAWALSSGAEKLLDGDKVLAGKTPEGDWYLVSPVFIQYCEAPAE